MRVAVVLAVFAMALPSWGALELEVLKPGLLTLRNGKTETTVPLDLIRSHLMNALHVDTWHFDNKNEETKFKLFSNDFALTVASAVSQRHKTQQKALRRTIEFFEGCGGPLGKSLAVGVLKKQLAEIAASPKGSHSLESVNLAIDSLIDELLKPDQKFRFPNRPSNVANILLSYLTSSAKASVLKFRSLNSSSESGLEMMTTGVTQEVWFEAMGTNPSFFSQRRYCPTEFREVRGVGLCRTWPVETVPLKSLRDFIRKMNFLNPSFVFRLPTRAERLSALNSSAPQDGESLKDVAWFGENSGLHPHPVGSKRPSPSGFYDLRGNLWEVTHDTESVIGKQVIAGGSWFDRSTALAVGYSMEIGDSWTCYDVGFRLVRKPAKPL
jgi:hypothetical protein